MVHHRFDLEAHEGEEGIRRKSGGGTEGGLDMMSRALQIPPTEVFEIITQHRQVYHFKYRNMSRFSSSTDECADHEI